MTNYQDLNNKIEQITADWQQTDRQTKKALALIEVIQRRQERLRYNLKETLDKMYRKEGKMLCPECMIYVKPHITHTANGADDYNEAAFCPVCEDLLYEE